MGKLFYIMGKSASGKDTIFSMLSKDQSLKLRKIIPYTTRPIRDGEQEGVAYHFVSDEAFEAMKAEGKVIESRTYATVSGPWHYFTADDGQLDFETEDGLMIGTLESYSKIRAYLGSENVVPLYIEVEDELRRARAISRENSQKIPNFEEMERRFKADAIDFSEKKLADLQISKRYVNDDLDRCYGEITKEILSEA